MSWIGDCPRRWPEVFSVLYDAIMERATYFGLTTHYNIQTLVSQASNMIPPLTELKPAIFNIFDAISCLVGYSCDPRKFGQWGTTMPFSDFMQTLEGRRQLCNELGINFDAFVNNRLRLVTNWEWAYACYVLLNEIALYRSPLFDFYATDGHIGVEGIEHYHSLTDPTLDYTKKLSEDGFFYYYAYWHYNDCKRWLTDLHLLNNNSGVTLTGNWYTKRTGNILHRSNLRDNIHLYEWENVETTISGNTSATFTYPIPQSVVNAVLSDTHEAYVTREELLIGEDRPSALKVTADNFPAPNYTYWDRT